MPTTRRRKIARSLAIRRVKQNAKRKERKTQKRKSRNIVMKGGVHKDLKLYVIQKKLEKPKCIIVRQTSLPRDTIYLFFDAHLDQAEIKEFVCAAMGLDVGAVITPELPFTSSEGEAINDLFIKLSGNLSYSLSSGKLYSYSGPISEITFQKHTTPKIDRKNGEAIIESLKLKTSTKEDYTFTEFTDDYYFEDEKFNLVDLSSLFDRGNRDTIKQLKTHCSQLITSPKIRELKKLVLQQSRVHAGSYNNARLFAIGNSNLKDKAEDKQNTIDEIKKAGFDFSGAEKLIDDIKRDTLYEKCKGVIDPECLDYIDGKKQFKSVEEIVTDNYNTDF